MLDSQYLELRIGRNWIALSENPTGCVLGIRSRVACFGEETIHEVTLPTQYVGDGNSRTIPLLRAMLEEKIEESIKASQEALNRIYWQRPNLSTDDE